MNNEEKLKTMSADMIARMLNMIAYEGFCNNWSMFNVDRECDHNCKECIKQWLKQKASEEEWTANL